MENPFHKQCFLFVNRGRSDIDVTIFFYFCCKAVTVRAVLIAPNPECSVPLGTAGLFMWKKEPSAGHQEALQLICNLLVSFKRFALFFWF